MKTIKILFASMLLCSVAFVSCKSSNSTLNKVEDDPIFNYQYGADGKSYWLEYDINSSGIFNPIYTVFKNSKITMNLDSLVINTALITPSKIAAWDASSGGSVSTPTNLASGSRAVNSSTAGATSYSVAVKTHVDISCGADINIGVLGSGTGYVYLETLQSGSSIWIRRGVVTKVKGSLIGLNTGNGGTYGVNLNAGDSYRLISSTTISGIGNSITYAMDGGSYYTY